MKSVQPMSFLVFLLMISWQVACVSEEPEIQIRPSSVELGQMFAEDQEARTIDSDEPMGPGDLERRKRVFDLLAKGAVVTAEDKFRAAMILNHTSLKFCGDEIVSGNPENYYLGHQLAQEAMAMGYSEARLLVAQTIDRYLYYTTGEQKYGTHRIIDMETGAEIVVPVDPSVTDEERAEYGVPPLADIAGRYSLEE